MDVCSADNLFLHLHIKVTWNDSRMAVLHIILWNDAVVPDPLFCEEIHGIGLLKQCISDILFIGQYLFYRFWSPPLFSCPCQYAVPFQPSANLQKALSFQVFPIDAFYSLRLVRLDDEFSVLILGISHEAIMVDLHQSLLIAILQTQLHILRKSEIPGLITIPGAFPSSRILQSEIGRAHV